MVVWACWAVVDACFHSAGALVLRLGMIFDTLGVYIVPCFVQDFEDVANISKLICIIFIPIGVAMMFEKLTGRNSFALLGGLDEGCGTSQRPLPSAGTLHAPNLGGHCWGGVHADGAVGLAKAPGCVGGVSGDRAAS